MICINTLGQSPVCPSASICSAQRDPSRDQRENISKPRLALFKRQGAEIFAVQFEQIEGVENDFAIVTAGVQAVEQGEARDR